MSKDPAFLFYAKDFYEGTRMMLPEERACYIDLMIYQHQHGYIPNDTRRVLMYCSGIDEAMLVATLEAKFTQSDSGWFNEKLNLVINERKDFSNKQSINGSVGAFWKKVKGLLSPKEYVKIKEYYTSKTNEEIHSEIVENDLKDEAKLQAKLQAMLKHLGNAIVIKDIDIFNWEKLILQFNQMMGKNTKAINETVKSSFKARIKEGYTKDDIVTTLENICKDEFHINNNFLHVTLEYVSRQKTIDKYINYKAPKKPMKQQERL